MPRLPISARLALLSTASLSALLALVGLVVYLQLGAGLRSGIDQQLADLAGSLPPRLAEDGFPAEEDDVDQLELSDRLVQLVDGSGQLVAASDDVDAAGPLLGPADLERVRNGDVVLRTVLESADEDDPLRVLAVPYGDDGLVAVLAAELDEVQDAQRTLLAVYGPVALFGVAVAGLLGFLIARRGLAPLRRMTGEAEVIGGSDLSRRLSAPARLDEIGRLARTLNGMLARLDAAICRERAFTADASHELRTPLAILRAEVELVRDRADDPSVRAALDTALAEATRLSGLVDDLLVLARADSGDLEDRRPVDLDELVGVVLARFATLAGRRGVRLESTGVAVVRCDSSGLERALTNLVDNALRHTPDGGVITVGVHPVGEDGAVIAVSDTGPGVPPERLDTLFDRFSRVDDARHEPGGAGLGLAIVSAVATAHSGTVTADNRAEGGLRVELTLGG